MRFHKHFFETIPSTQVYAQERCNNGTAAVGDVVVAIEQTGGYGRRGRAWQSPPGNLYFTLIEKKNSIDELSWLGYAMGLGLYDALKPLLKPEADLRLKWPNDLLLNDAKLSGLLLEVVDDNILIGVGLNVEHAPETDQAITALNKHTITKQAAADLITPILRAYDVWHGIGRRQGFAGMRAAWLEKSAFKGREITAKLANGVVLQGVFHDLDPQGALVLQTGHGEKRITAADIYLL